MFDDIQERVVRILKRIKPEQNIDIGLETDLFAAGVLDSFGMIEFLTGLEKEFEIKISNEDLVQQNLCTVKASTQLVRGYLVAKKDVQI